MPTILLAVLVAVLLTSPSTTLELVSTVLWAAFLGGWGWLLLRVSRDHGPGWHD